MKYNTHRNKLKPALFTAFLLFSLTNLSFAQNTLKIDLNKIKQIESSGNPLAYNPTSQARGLYQITPICLKEYNNFHTKKYSTQDLFNPTINEKIAKWYLTKRIPQMLRYYNKPITTSNILISYNAGINYVVKGLSLPTETRNYIQKYKGSSK
jgi:soluble lytic murein transglycosylase-like protein